MSEQILASPYGFDKCKNKMKTTFRFVFMLCVALSATVSYAQVSEPNIAARLNEFVTAGKTAGAVFIVAHKGNIQSGAVGVQDLETKAPMRADTIFQIASMTKPITAVGIMLLADEGRLSINDPVAKYLPKFADLQVAEKQPDGTTKSRKPARAITLRDLLTHTSGLGGGYPEGFGDLWEKRNRKLSDLVDAIPTRTLQHEPGARWAYSNIGIATLGRICEIVAGKPYEQFLVERIFAPLEMSDTHFFVPAAKRSRIATIYEAKDGKLAPAAVDRERTAAIYPAPEGGLYSTAPDLLRFYQMMLNHGTFNGRRILSRNAVKLMTQNHTGELTAGFAPGLGFGLGWQVVRNVEGIYRGQSIGTYLHGGLWKTYGWIDPDKQLIGILMMQRLSSDGDQSDELNALTQMAAAAIE